MKLKFLRHRFIVGGLLGSLAVLLVVACSPSTAPAPTAAPAAKAPAGAAPTAGPAAPGSVETKVKYSATGTKPAVPEAQLKADKPYKLAFFVKNVVNPFWKAARKGGDDAAAKYGVQLIHYAPTQPDNTPEQTRIMEDVIAKKEVDGIVFVPTDFKAQVAVVEKANKAGIPIYNYCNQMAGGEVVSYVGSDDFVIGQQIIEWLAKDMGGKGNLILLEGVPGAITAENRKRGWQDALKKYPNFKVLASQAADYSRAKAVQVTENLLQSQPNVDAIVGANDETALGAIAALEGVGKAGKVRVTGVDALSPDTMQAIKDGKLSASVDYGGYEMGYKSVELAVRHLNGEKIEQPEVALPFKVVDKSNVDQNIERLKKLGLMQ